MYNNKVLLYAVFLLHQHVVDFSGEPFPNQNMFWFWLAYIVAPKRQTRVSFRTNAYKERTCAYKLVTSSCHPHAAE